MYRSFISPLLALFLLFGLLPARADDAVSGLSRTRLLALDEQIRADVSAQRMPGGVLLVMRDGKLVHSAVYGHLDPATSAPMKRDALFRVYSMTKPVVSVAAMMLVEDGRITLTDPVSQYLPELKGLKVGVEKSDANGNPVLEAAAAPREMTVLDLLRHTSGLTYGFEGKSLVKDEYKKLGVDTSDQTNAEMLGKLARIPLQSAPGSRWEYSVSTDVLGMLLERAAGKPLDKLLAERVFAPLKMVDSGFWVEPSRQGRIAEPFEIDPVWKIKTPLTDIRLPPKRFSGGGGMVSTADDYLRFLQMLLNGGELDGVHLLSRKSIELMLADQLAPLRAAAPGAAILGPRPGFSYGLGFAVRTDSSAPTLGSIGMADWNGIAGTHFWIDPKERLAVVWMMQAPGQRIFYQQLIPNRIYGAMRD
jgi:CubicO group peptidase (beta-lactamase class C family)